MEIIIGKNAGFCYGVKRAVDGTLEVLKDKKEVFCLGELVHNKAVIDDLIKNGATFIDELSDDVKDVIIRAHGVTKEIYEKLEQNKINYFDYTCPNVLNIHKIAEEYSKKGYFIFLIGDSKHPENIGTISFCGQQAYIIENENNILEGLEKFELSKKNKLLIIAQTTYSVTSFNNIVDEIKNGLYKDVEIIVKNTICNATEIRQKETKELSKEVDYMIIIGGKNSSNTKKLYDIAKNNCKNACCIENKDELDTNDIKKYEKIGIMAGASTPQSSINEIKKELENKKI